MQKTGNENQRPYDQAPIELELEDREWPMTYIDHDRTIVRAIVFDDAYRLYFAEIRRDDIFGCGTFLETAGGGVEAGESLPCAIAREVREELGAEVEILCKLGVVKDYYNLIHRRNVNHYFLCRVKSIGEPHRTAGEIHDLHLSTRVTDYEDALARYRERRDCKLGRLLANRELPILTRAGEILKQLQQEGLS